MSKPRIHLYVLRERVEQIIQIYAAERVIQRSDPSAAKIYSCAEDLAFTICAKLLNDYAIVRKSRTERTV